VYPELHLELHLDMHPERELEHVPPACKQRVTRSRDGGRGSTRCCLACNSIRMLTGGLRVTRLCEGAMLDADMEISAPKSEVMFCRPRVDTGAIRPEDYSDAALKDINLKLEFRCPHCDRGFVCRHGRSVHIAQQCDLARVEYFPEEFEIGDVIDVRGPPESRFYRVAWKGYPESEASWKHSSFFENADGCVADFWNWAAPSKDSNVTVEGEHRCIYCNKFCKRAQDLKRHFTMGCPRLGGSRVGTKAERAVAKARQVMVQDAAGIVMMGSKRLTMVFNFKYLGFNFQADGDRRPALDQRMAIARSRFAELHEIWRDKKLPVSAKVRIYACAVVSVLTYGSEIWRMDAKTMASLRGWNGRCLSSITGRSIRDETVDPQFDLVSRLRSRRLRWAGHILRMEEPNLMRRVLLSQVQRDLDRGSQESGGLLMDALDFDSAEQLLLQASDREEWRLAVIALLPASDPAVKKAVKKTPP
jgi:hypothetical protein